MKYTHAVSKRYMSALANLYGDPSQTTIETKKPRHKPPIKPGTHSEYENQVLFVTWVRSMGIPIFSIPNHGRRSQWDGLRQKAMGLYPGATDLFLMKPTKKYHGYFIEMKATGKKPTLLQIQFMELAQKMGYKAAWFDDWEKAKVSVEEYLNEKK